MTPINLLGYVGTVAMTIVVVVLVIVIIIITSSSSIIHLLKKVTIKSTSNTLSWAALVLTLFG